MVLGAQAPREVAENELKLSLSMGEGNARNSWMCYVYGCVMLMDVLCKLMCYVSGCVYEREKKEREEKKEEGGGRDAFKTRTHTRWSGGKK